MADASRYVAGESIRWGSLIRDSVGALLLGYWLNVAEVVSAVIGAITTSISGIGSWLSELVRSLVLLPLPGMERAFATAGASLETFGIAGYIVGLAIVVVTLVVIAELLLMAMGWS